MKKVIITTVVATLTAVAVIGVLYGGWRAYIHARESDPVEQARKTSACNGCASWIWTHLN